MRQDGSLETSSHIVASEFCGFRKFRLVEVTDGEIRGEFPMTTDSAGWWRPFDAYYGEQTKPYMALVECGWDNEKVKRFLENYGPIGTNLQPSVKTGVYRLAEFHLEQWLLHFAVALSGLMGKAYLVQKALVKAIEDAHKNAERIERENKTRKTIESAGAWRQIIRRIVIAARLRSPKQEPPQETDFIAYLTKHIDSLTERRLIATAHSYLTQELWRRLEKVRLFMEFPSGKQPRLMADCPDTLTSFYFMLARDWDAGRAPLVCGYCKRFFIPQRKNASYCERSKCKEQGRKNANWERHKAKYARARKRKRLRGRRAEGFRASGTR